MKPIHLCFFLLVSIAAIFFSILTLPSPATAQEATAVDCISVSGLFEPRVHLELKPTPLPQGKIERVGAQWRITGESPLQLHFSPGNGGKWDFSGHRLAGLRVTNNGGGIVTLSGKLQNSKPTSWSHHAVGFCVAPSGEETTLGFPFPMPDDRYQGPEVLKDQLGRADGHRLHWRLFHPEDVRSLTLELRSSTGKVDVLLGDLFGAWSASPETSAALNTMPYLDAMGQVRAVHWPGKADSFDEARATLLAEYEAAAQRPRNSQLSLYGGWLTGPKREASGRFRTEKVEGKWWLIDPDGYLFFSIGACMAGHQSETPVNPLRRKDRFFTYVPDDKDPLRWAGLKWVNGLQLINYPSLNYARFFGADWEKTTRKGDLDRMADWGLNTLGCWSDEAMQKERRLPYTLIASPWWRPGNHNMFPSPFSNDFEPALRAALAKLLWAKDDPFLLGVFLGNELNWPDEITPLLFDESADPATRSWAIERMKQKYGALDALNAAWKTGHTDWKMIHNRASREEIPERIRADLEPLYPEFATTFFKRCKTALESVMPGTLYLGCRTHRGPKFLGRAAVGHVDVFSVNVYDSQVRANQLTPDVDLPIVSSEFHFGAVDRGVPSPGLVGVWDQRQRGLAFAHYLASALADPRFVGIHWFQWLDQSAAARPDRENHGIGFLDVTGRSHREFVETVSKSTRRLYEARKAEKMTTEKTLEALLQP